jgi:hypothetical protein
VNLALQVNLVIQENLDTQERQVKRVRLDLRVHKVHQDLLVDRDYLDFQAREACRDCR